MLTTEEKEQYAIENFDLIYHMVNKFRNIRHIEEAEFVSAAHIGFTRALNNYDKSRNIKLTTFVCSCIEKEFLRIIRHSNCQIRKGIHEKELSLDKKRLEDYDFYNVMGYLDKNIETMDSKLLVEAVKERLDARRGLVLEKMLEGKPQRKIVEEIGESRGYVHYSSKFIKKELKKELERVEL